MKFTVYKIYKYCVQKTILLLIHFRTITRSGSVKEIAGKMSYDFGTKLELSCLILIL